MPRSYSFYKTVGGTGTRTTRNFLLRAREQKRDEHGASFQSSPNYRKWSIKRRGAYFLFPVKGAAPIQEWRLFESGAYFNYRYNTEGNIKPRIKWGAYYIHFNIIFFFLCNRVFSLTWPASMQIYWNKRMRLHKKRVQLPQDPFGTPTWPQFHCFGTPIWPPWRHVKKHSAWTMAAALKLCSVQVRRLFE